MPATAPPVAELELTRLKLLGERLRLARKQQGVSAVAAAEAAGMSRVTLHRIERGEPSVTIGAWAAAAAALGLVLDLRDGNAVPKAETLPERIRLDEYPQLKSLAWQLGSVAELTPREALDLYERNWRHMDRQSLTAKEVALIHALAGALGGGRLLV